MVNIYIFRHGQTDWNVEKRLQGHTDIPLNQIGHEQAEELKKKFHQLEIEAIYSSDLSRAIETAKKISEFKNVPIFKTSLLRESHMGDATGLTQIEVNEKFGDMWERFLSPKREHLEMFFPNGESKKTHLNNALNFIHEKANHHQNFAISTHGGVILKLLHYYFNYDENREYRVPNCSLHHFQFLNGNLNYLGLID